MKKMIVLLFLPVYFHASAQQDKDNEGIKNGFEKQRLFTGGSANLGFSSGTTMIGLTPQLGYSVTDWMDAGITVNIINTPADSYWDVTWMKTPFFSSSWNGRSVPEALAYTFTTGAEFNEGRWSNAEYDALVEGARIETDAAKRTEMIKQAQEILATDGGIIIPAFFVDTAVLRAACTGYVPHPSAAIYNFETLTCEK